MPGISAQTQSSHALKQLDLECMQAADLGVCPQCVDARERLAAEQRERVFERCPLLFSRLSLSFTAEAIEVIEIDPELLAIECVGVAVAYEGIAEQFPRLACCLIEAACAAAGIVAGPEGFQKLVATCRTSLHSEVRDQLCCRLSPRLFLLAARELKRPEKQNTEPLVARLRRCNLDRRRKLARTVCGR
jgi:hypothetical protein